MRGLPNGRAYIAQSFIDRVRDARAAIPAPKPEDPNWITFDAAKGMGFDKKFLLRYSASKDPRRILTALSHPHLGHPIKTKAVSRLTRQQLVHGIRFWKPDLEKILNIREQDPAKWMPRALALQTYQIPESVMHKYEKRGGPFLDGKKIVQHWLAQRPEKHRDVVGLYCFVPNLERIFNGIHGHARISADAARRSRGRRAGTFDDRKVKKHSRILALVAARPKDRGEREFCYLQDKTAGDTPGTLWKAFTAARRQKHRHPERFAADSRDK